LENRTGPQKRRAADVEKTIGYFGRGRFRSRFESIYESGCSHPGSPEKEKGSCRKTTKERQRQQRETIIIGRCSPREIGPVCECQNAETGRQAHARNWKIGNVIFW